MYWLFQDVFVTSLLPKLPEKSPFLKLGFPLVTKHLTQMYKHKQGEKSILCCDWLPKWL